MMNHLRSLLAAVVVSSLAIACTSATEEPARDEAPQPTLDTVSPADACRQMTGDLLRAACESCRQMTGDERYRAGCNECCPK